jgi:hypothetical protein
MIAAAFVLAPWTAPEAEPQALISKTEAKCASKLGKSAAKLAKVAVKKIGKCREKVLAGKEPGPCPDAKTQAKIDKLTQKVMDQAGKKCFSVCSVSAEIECISSSLCPPLGDIGTAELCFSGAKNEPFDMGNLGFPGPFCEDLLGRPLTEPRDIGECVSTLVNQIDTAIVDVLYGGLDMPAEASGDAQKCLKKISKATQKLVAQTFKGVVKCRDKINKGKLLGNPATCRFDDEKLGSKLVKAQEKLQKALDTKCNDTLVQELDLCGAGVGGIATTSAAYDCLVGAALEIADAQAVPNERDFSTISLIDAAYPPEPVCGDDVVNQIPNKFLLIGEECDGTDDAACPGNCLPPGDTFECTCAGPKRLRFLADGLTADLDNGWTGTSHESGVTDEAGYVYELSNCDCDSMADATCIGTTADSVCDVSGKQLPTCSWDPLSATRCDAHGNANFTDTNSDCYICDAFAANAGDYCKNEGDCASQCYDAFGTPVGACQRQTDCGAGEVCRGQCDRSQSCIIIPNGAPLPISSGGTAVCVVTEFRQDIFGTQNIVTGEHEMFIQQFSKVHLGVTSSVPCPVCGGFCDGLSSGSPLVGNVCQGTCEVSGDDCRFDSDCPGVEVCTTASPRCGSGFCNLSLVCGGGQPGSAGPNSGKACRLSAYTTDFGTVSNDCPPSPGQNISGLGLEVNFFPQTSEAVSLPATMPCSSPGFELFDCPCPDDGGIRTRPNLCAGACNAGAELGQGCANGGGFINGEFTSCAGGANAGFACDEDSDCPGSSCSDNPTHCVGDPGFDRLPCTTNADCGLGTCEDACPSGRCVPLCSPGADGEFDEGFCAAGPSFYHCDGVNDTFRICTKAEANAGCSATCSVSATSCSADGDCPIGETCNGACDHARLCEAGVDGVLGTSDDFPGAGVCVADIRNCFVNDLATEGGDIFNGEGDPTNVKAVSTYCVGATSNGAINSTAGLGGPGRLRQKGVNVSNGFVSLP